MSFVETFGIIIVIVIVILYLLTVAKKDSTWFRQKKLIKISQKRRKIIYFIKTKRLNFVSNVKFYQNFKNDHKGRLNKTYLVNICLFFYHHKYSVRTKQDIQRTWLRHVTLATISVHIGNLILIWVGYLGVRFEVRGKVSPCLKLVRIILETWNLVLKYTPIYSFRKYTF